MHADQLKTIFPKASRSFLDLNGLPPSPLVKPIVFHGANGKAARKEKDPIRRLVSITSFRVREIDPDNLIGKYFVDSLRYAGLLHDDGSKHIIYQISQKKVEHKTQEKTLITIQ